MKSRFILILLSIIAIQCKKDCIESDRCTLDPVAGPCFATITKFYYDSVEKKCKPFTWGGCDGVVPFQTMEECEAGCGCD
jgi:hypothetical protein